MSSILSTTHSHTYTHIYTHIYIDSSGQLNICKTGLGSSAALTVSLVGALLEWFQVIDVSRHSEKHMVILHNLCQLAHANAQGKIGSGFDVAAAVYGITLLHISR